MKVFNFPIIYSKSSQKGDLTDDELELLYQKIEQLKEAEQVSSIALSFLKILHFCWSDMQ